MMIEGKKSETRPWRAVWVFLTAAFFMAGCEAFFTHAPMEFLQRDPSSMTGPQKLEFASIALASGDKKDIHKAYKAIQKHIEDNNMSGDRAVEFNTMAVDLLSADSGAGPLFDQVAAEFVAGEEPELKDVNLMVKDLGISYQESDDMLSYLTAVSDNGGSPEPMQSILAAGVILAPVIADNTDADGNCADITGTSQFTAAKGVVQAAAADMEDGSDEKDQLYELADQLNMDTSTW